MRRLITVFAAFAILSGAAFSASASPSASVTESAPVLTARIPASQTRVYLRWKFATTSLQRDRVLQIARDTGTGYTVVITKPKPGKTGSVTDHYRPTGPTSYRARLLVKGQAGEWGLPATVLPTPTTTTSSTSTTVPVGVVPCPDAWDDIVISDVNRERQTAGKVLVVEHPKLGSAADERGRTLATQRALNHDGWVQTIQASGYVFGSAAENIAVYTSAESVVGVWMNSPGHRVNILNDYWIHVGVGCSLDSRGVPWWSLLLAYGPG